MLLRLMSVSDRKARSRAILVFFGLDRAPSSFRNARPPNVLDVLQARFRLRREQCPGLLYTDLFRKSVLPKERNVFLHSMWKRACGGL